MAGTRLALSIVYAIELLALVVLAVKYGISKSMSKSPKWYPANQPFMPIRSGVALLHRHDFEKILNDVRETIVGEGEGDDGISIEVGLELTLMDRNGRKFSPSLRDEVLTTLQQAERRGQELESFRSSSSIQPKFRISNDDKMAAFLDIGGSNGVDLNLCNDEIVKEILQQSESSIGFYQIYVARMDNDDGCSEPILDVHESGSMMLRIPHHFSDEDIIFIIESHLWPTFHQLLHSEQSSMQLQQRRRSLSRPTRIILSIVDSNPSSRANLVREKNTGMGTDTGKDNAANKTQTKPKLKALHHNGVLSQVVKEAVEQSLLPMVETKLSQWIDATLVAQSLPYYGMDLSSYAELTAYENASPDHTLSIHDAKSLLLHGDLAYLAQGFVSPVVDGPRPRRHPGDVNVGSSNDDFGYDNNYGNHNDIQLILYVPDGDAIPLYIVNGLGGWSTALTIPDKNLALSIINLPIPLDMSTRMGGSHLNSDEYENVKEKINMEQHQVTTADLEEAYRHEVRGALSQLGSFLRRHFGLSPMLQPASNNIHGNTKSFTVNYLRPEYAIAQWEMDRLIRENIGIKARDILETLGHVYELIHLRKGMSVSMKSAEKMIHCMTILQESVGMLTTGDSGSHSLHEVNSLLNQAAQLAYMVSKDEDMFEVPYFALDQLFAVFGSLLLPLVVPMLKNLNLEIKRYKQKRKAKTKVEVQVEKENNIKVKDE